MFIQRVWHQGQVEVAKTSHHDTFSIFCLNIQLSWISRKVCEPFAFSFRIDYVLKRIYSRWNFWCPQSRVSWLPYRSESVVVWFCFNSSNFGTIGFIYSPFFNLQVRKTSSFSGTPWTRQLKQTQTTHLGMCQLFMTWSRVRTRLDWNVQNRPRWWFSSFFQSKQWD